MSNTACRGKWCGSALLIVFLVIALLPPGAMTAENSKWSGVDEAVIEKFAKEHGREAKEPLIDKDQGDLLLFLFLLAGAAGGFAAGYYWRVLFGAEKFERKDQNCSFLKRTG